MSLNLFLYRISFYFFLLAFSSPAFAQNKKIDSLRTTLKNAKEDTNDVNSWNALAKEYSKLDPDSSILLAKKALPIAMDLKFNYGISKSYFWVGTGFSSKGSFSDALKNFDLALQYAPDKRSKAKALINVGSTQFDLGDYQQAMQTDLSALALWKELKIDKEIANSYSEIGLVYKAFGNFPEALKYQLNALRIREQIGETKRLPQSYSNLAVIYGVQGNFKEARKYQTMALNMAEETGDRMMAAKSFNNLGIINDNMGDFPEAIRNCDSCMAIYQKLSDVFGVAGVYSGLGAIYTKKGEYRKALDNFLFSIDIIKKAENKEGVASVSNNIGEVYILTHDYKSAKKYLSDALSIAMAVSDKDDIKIAYYNYSRLDSATGDFRSAYEHYKKYVNCRDSLQNEENTKKQTRFEMQYEFDKKQSADSIKNAEKTKREQLKHEQEIQQQRIYSYGGAIGFSLMMVVALVSFRAYRQKQTANSIISLQKELVEEKQKEILDSIHYAKRIQSSLLPTEKYIDRTFKRMKRW